jgi:type III secretion system (T3SS) inner membrane Yop/YscD-like protein
MLLRVLTGKASGKTVRITGEQFVVGRRRGCDLVLRDETLRDRHAVFHADGAGRYALEDLGSESGTFVDGIRIRGTVELRGDEPLCFGETFATLTPGTYVPKRRRRTLVVAVAAASVLAAAGVTAGVLAPHTGAGPGLATIAAPRVAPSAELPPVEPPPAPAPAQPAPQASDTQGESGPKVVVYRDDFSDDASGWEVFDEPAVMARYDHGAFVMRVNDSRWYATADSGRTFDEPVVSIAVTNPTRTKTGGFGIVCHYTGQRRFYVLAVGTDGTYAILRQRGNRLTVLTGGGHWAPSELVPVGAERYAVRADCRDGRLRLFVNAHEVAEVRAQAPPGHIGLFMAGLAEFRFDQLVVVDQPM